MNRCRPLIFTLWTLLFSGFTQAHPQVIHVIPIKNPTYAEEYQCVTESNPEHTKYSWYRQGWDALPEGVTAEGDRLHFLKSTPYLNGLYICTAENEFGAAAAHPQVVHVKPVENPTYAEEYQCVTESNPVHTKYSWSRQGWDTFPEDVKAEGDRLHFLKSTSDLNGLYICEVDNQFGAAAGSLYRYKRCSDGL